MINPINTLTATPKKEVVASTTFPTAFPTFPTFPVICAISLLKSQEAISFEIHAVSIPLLRSHDSHFGVFSIKTI